MERMPSHSVTPLARCLLTGTGLLVSLCAGSVPALAQVAAPSLVPFTFVTENPAVIQWGGPSRAGVAYGQQQIVTNPPTVTDNFTGYGGGLRLVGSRFSFAAEGNRFDSSNNPYGVNESTSYGAAALALRIGNRFSFGLSQSSQDNTQFNPLFGLRERLRFDESVGGITLRLGEWFFLGGAGGRDFVRADDLTSNQTHLSTAQDVYKYGAGIRTGGAILTHFEYYVIDRTNFSNPAIAGGRETGRTGVAEVNFGGFLLAYSTTHTERDIGQDTTDLDTGAIGIAPYTGLTVVVLGNVEVDKHPPGSPFKSTTTTSYTLAITYLFGG